RQAWPLPEVVISLHAGMNLNDGLPRQAQAPHGGKHGRIISTAHRCDKSIFVKCSGEGPSPWGKKKSASKLTPFRKK
ncbi:MAG: hypothetical protein MK554_06530, partial [Planctomycetes bacterium]|nr:hypothetical protein [Planctomycetota bacterium]